MRDRMMAVLAVGILTTSPVATQPTGLDGAAGNTAAADSSPEWLDTSFNAGANDAVKAILVQPDGKILVAGDFTTLGGGGTGTAARNYIGRLNADGSPDTSFNPGASGSVYAMALQPDGKILVGGYFSGLGGGTGTTPRSNLGRLNADGSVDGSFDPGASYVVNALAAQSDGKILVGGSFARLGGGGTGTTTRFNIGRLNSTGTVDTGFNPGANDAVSALTVQADGRILVGGSFTRLGGGSDGTTTRQHIGRINADGSLDTSFDPGADVRVAAFAVQAGGRILVGGYFTKLGGGGTGTTTRNGIGRLNVDGSLDTSFNPGVGGTLGGYVYALVEQGDGKILVGGGFTRLGGGGTGTASSYNIGRLNADGSPDTAFSPGADNEVYTVAVQPDGRILVGGFFTRLGGGTGTTTRSRIGRLQGSEQVAGAPGAPSGLTATAAGSNVSLAWTAPITGGAVTAYLIEAGTGPTAADLANFSTGTTATTFTASGIGSGIYYVRVRATNSLGASGPSNEAILIVGGSGCTVPPGIPGGLTLTQNSGGSVAFTWSGASGGPGTYVLEAGSAPGLSNLAVVDLGGTGTAFATSGVAAGVYYVRVKAANACGTSGASNEVVVAVQ